MMKKSLLFIAAICLSISGCSDYIASKRDGLKQFKQDPVERQAQESDEAHK